MTIRSITHAFDSKLWVTLPEAGATYASLKIALKLANLGIALRAYPSVRGAGTASGINLNGTKQI